MNAYIGMKLDNGAMVIAASAVEPGGLGCVDIQYVLAMWGQEYAVWNYRTDDGACYRGSYFNNQGHSNPKTTILAALDEYFTRIDPNDCYPFE